jgi:hypothetical protein
MMINEKQHQSIDGYAIVWNHNNKYVARRLSRKISPRKMIQFFSLLRFKQIPLLTRVQLSHKS